MAHVPGWVDLGGRGTLGLDEGPDLGPGDPPRTIARSFKHSEAGEDGGQNISRQERRRIDEEILVLVQTHRHCLRGTKAKLKEERGSPNPPPPPVPK